MNGVITENGSFGYYVVMVHVRGHTYYVSVYLTVNSFLH